MRTIILFAILLGGSCASAQAPGTSVPNPSTDIIYVCPDDESIRANGPGSCGDSDVPMVPAIPDPVEYLVDLELTPRTPQPGEAAELTLRVLDPWQRRSVTSFSIVHEQLLHLFVVSEDLEVFMHVHPEWRGGAFHLDVTFPKPGMYRLLANFYPEAGTPQLIARTLFVAGARSAPAQISRDYSPKTSENLRIELSTSPSRPATGTSTLLVFGLSPGDGLEEYLGAWAHAFIASDDLIDLIHTHPFLADGSTQIQFPVTFPRARSYRIWVQVRRSGIVNTARFDIPVGAPNE